MVMWNENMIELQKECGETSEEEIINSALTMFKWAIRQVKIGNAIGSLNSNSTVFTQLGIPLLDKNKA